MKNLILLILFGVFVISSTASKAQNRLSKSTQVEVGVGYLRPHFQKGIELMRSGNLRKNGLSYYADANGNRNSVGKYSSSSGFNITIGFYKPIKFVKNLMVGALIRNAQTGSTPDGGYEEAYFFNFITAGPAVKYYPFERTNVYLKVDVGLAAVLTKNRFINDVNQQNFFHQFGIGSAVGVETGYALTPFPNKSRAIELKAGYQLANTRVEVNGIGDDHWRFGAGYIGTSFNF
jgi:hypothetical protein